MYRLRDDVQQEEMETMHVYLYREPIQQPLTLQRVLQIGLQVLLIIASSSALMTLAADQPVPTIQTVTVPLRFLPLTKFVADAKITPTGWRVYPAVSASGILTVYNGSVLTQRLPQGFILTADNGVEIVIDSDVTVGPADPPSYGVSTVQAHAVLPGHAGNIPAYSVDAVYGADVYVKNLSSFSGGGDQKTVNYATDGDVHVALISAQETLIFQQYRHGGLLYAPCRAMSQRQALTLHVTWLCQYVTFTPPQGQVLSARLSGRQIVLQVRRSGA
jgi:hypothetical protein